MTQEANEKNLTLSGEDHLVAFLREFCALCGLDEEALLDEAPMDIEGVEFQFRYSAERFTDGFFVTCDFGAAPADCAVDIYKSLLAQNFVFYRDNGPVLGIAPDTEHVTFVDQYRLADITPEKLRNRLSNLAAKALAWRHTQGNKPMHTERSTVSAQLQQALNKR